MKKFSFDKGPKQIFAVSFSVIVVLVILGFYGHLSNGREFLWQTSVSPSVSKMYYLISEAKTLDLHSSQDNGSCKFNVQQFGSTVQKRIQGCFKKFGAGVAIISDSHAIDLFGAISSVAKSEFIIGVTQGYCRPHNPLPYCQYTAFQKFVSQKGDIFKAIVFEQTARSLIPEFNKQVQLNMS